MDPIKPQNSHRITRLQLFSGLLDILAKRGTCPRARVGIILARDSRIVATGYNGAPTNMSHCLDVGCLLSLTGGCIRAVHAEANVIAFAAREGIRTQDTALYVSLAPCLSCAQLIINAGISDVFYQSPYRNPEGLRLLESVNIKTTYIGDLQLAKETTLVAPI
mgnify:CR=1 FL=1